MKNQNQEFLIPVKIGVSDIMPVASSPSDYTAINVDYSTGNGFYTDKDAVSDMLQVPAFSSSTYPSQAQVGAIIKNIEGIVDDKVKRSYRPIIYENEFHLLH